MNDLESKIIDFVKKYNFFDKQKVIVIGFSGGYDSFCLLDILQKNSNKFKFKLIAAHLNHAWRGEESDQEEQTAKEFCKNTGIEFYSEKLSVNIPHTELEARNQRYNFFNKVAKKYHADGIFTGHTLTDQAETVLYRILKGTGIKGLQGIPEIRYQNDSCPIYRPMLDIKREDTIKYCQDNNLKTNIDSSNLNEDYLRNKIRLNLIPELKNYNLHVEEALIRLSDIAKDNENIVNEYILSVEKNIYVDKSELMTEKYLILSNAVKKKIIINFLTSQNLEYDYKKINEIVTFIENNICSKSGNTISLTHNAWLFVSEKQIKIINSIKANVVKSSVRIDLNGLTKFEALNKILKISEWNQEKPDKFPDEKSNIIYVDLDNIKGNLYLRTRQEGDIIKPFGMNHRMKLKKYLINKGIPEFERDKLPVLATENEVLWVVGVGTSETVRVKNTPSHIIEINED